MDILLVNASPKRISQHSKLNPPLGLSYIASVLIQAGYDVSAIDFNVGGFNALRLTKILEEGVPKILGVSTQTETYLNGLKIAEIAKQVNPAIIVVMGGPHVTVMAEEAAREKDLDVVVRGEGEYTMLELANVIIRKKNDLKLVRGIAYREDGKIKITPDRPFIEVIDELPFPARELFPLPLYASPGTVLMSRGGCPFNCLFCAVNNIWQGRRRFRKPEKVVEEIYRIIMSGQARDIIFVDDTFTLDRGRVIDLCHLLKDADGSLRFRWKCSTRVDLVDNELLKEMYYAGCCGIQFGVESISPRILDSIGKKITPEQVRNAVRTARDVGMEVVCSFMFPHPEDTEETIRELKTFMIELGKMGVEELLSFTSPFPGTYYYKYANELGIKLLANSWDEYDAKHLIISTKFLSIYKLECLLSELVRDVGLETKP